MCPFLRNFARLPHIKFIYLDALRYAEAYYVKKTQLFDKSTKARTSLEKYYILTRCFLSSFPTTTIMKHVEAFSVVIREKRFLF